MAMLQGTIGHMCEKLNQDVKNCIHKGPGVERGQSLCELVGAGKVLQTRVRSRRSWEEIEVWKEEFGEQCLDVQIF